MAKLTIEIQGAQTLTCDGCGFQSLTSIGKFCPQCQAEFTEVEYFSEGLKLKASEEPENKLEPES